MKTLYLFLLVALATFLADAQTDTILPSTTPTTNLADTNVPPPIAIPTRIRTRTNAVTIPPLVTTASTSTVSTTTSATTAATNTAPIVPEAVPDASAIPSRPLVPPTIGIPSEPQAITRTNTAGEVANIRYDFPAMPLEQILQIYSELVGRTLLRGTGLQPQLLITLKTQGDLTRSEAVMALETVLAMNGVTFVPIGEKFAKVVLEAQAPAAGGKFIDGDPDDLPDAGRYVTQIVQLEHAQGAEVQAAVGLFAKTPASVILMPTSNTLILRDYSENVKRMMEIIKKIDVVVEMNVKPEVIPIKYALAADISQVLGSLTASGPGVSVGRGSRGAGVTSSGYQPGTTGTGGFNRSGVNPQQTQPGQSPLGSPGTTGQSSFQQNLSRIVSKISGSGDFQVIGDAKIIADERTNSLLIFANDQDMVMIKTIIAQLDVVLAQVLIEAIIMEVSLDNGQQLGVSYLRQPITSGSFTGVGGVNNGQQIPNLSSNASGFFDISSFPSGFSYFGSFADKFDVAITALANDSRINVLSRPRIQTSHAVAATLFIGDTVPYITGTSFGNFNGGTTSQYQEKRVGITLDVLPLINPDGLVVMDIQQNIQQLGTSVVIDGNQVPTTTERSAQAKVAVRDGETIILGGFISTSKNKSKSGVPYLKDIPGLGLLFRSSSDILRRVELIVLLRPKVLPTPEAAAIVAATERDKLSGVKQGEFEIREMERKRQEQLDQEMRRKLGIKDRPL